MSTLSPKEARRVLAEEAERRRQVEEAERVVQAEEAAAKAAEVNRKRAEAHKVEVEASKAYRASQAELLAAVELIQAGVQRIAAEVADWTRERAGFGARMADGDVPPLSGMEAPHPTRLIFGALNEAMNSTDEMRSAFPPAVRALVDQVDGVRTKPSVAAVRSRAGKAAE